MNKTQNFDRQQVEGFTLTTAEIVYHLPDMPHLLQIYVWQDYDLAPRFPVLGEFLNFWTREIDGPLHSIIVAEHRLIKVSDLTYYTGEFQVQ